MNDPQQTLAKALRIVPRRDRDRYREEWGYDFANAATAGVSESEIAAAALRMAWRLRLRQAAQIMTGGYGGMAAVIAWVVLITAAVGAFMLGGLVLILVVALFLVAIGAMTLTGVPSYWSHWALIASGIVAVLAFGYVWWVSGVLFNSNEAGSPIPPAARFGGIGLILTGLGVVGVVAMSVVSASHTRRRNPKIS
jgi:hypothetical protein